MKTAVSTHEIKVYPENDFEVYHAEVAKDIEEAFSENEVKEREWFNLYEARTKTIQDYARILDDVHKMIEACKEAYKANKKPTLYEQIPFWEKFNLTINEAAAYFGIGQSKIGLLVNRYKDEKDFTLKNGRKIVIKKAKFEEFLNDQSEI